MNYVALPKEEQDEIVVQYLKAQERDHYCHVLNRDRFETILATAPPGEFKERIAKLHAETVSRIVEVETIIASTAAQLPAAPDVQRALGRLAEKEAAASVKT